MTRVHVIGAGLAGISAAMHARALGAEVIVHEQTGHAGGRARSFMDAKLGCEIDNGNHLMLSGNASVLKLCALLGSSDELARPDAARFDFYELDSGLRWALELDDGPLPLWLFDAARRVPGTSVPDYLKGLKLLFAGNASVDRLFNDGGSLWRRFWEPFAVGVLNTEPDEAAARLLLPVIRETLARGGRFSTPMVARRGLSHVFAHPFEKAAARDGKLDVRLSHGLNGLEVSAGRADVLKFDDGDIVLDDDSKVILAVSPWAARALMPALMTPGRFSPIVNVHFRLEAGRMPREAPLLRGVLGGVSQWVFRREDVASVTISAAHGLVNAEAAEIARRVWPEVARTLGIDDAPQPAFRVIKERRATFAATPAELARRPGPETGLANLILAGDWVDNGLPATIEGAVRSGETAARIALEHAQ